MYWDNDEWEEKNRRREKREKAKTSVECPVCNAPSGSDCYAKVKRGHTYVFSNIDDPTTKWRADAHKRLQKPHQERVDIVRPDLAERRDKSRELRKTVAEQAEEDATINVRWVVEWMDGQWPHWARAVGCETCGQKKSKPCIDRRLPGQSVPISQAHEERVRRAALSIRRTEQREARVRAKNRRESAVRIAQKEAQEVRFKVGLKNARKKAYAKLCDEALEIAKRRYGDTE